MIDMRTIAVGDRVRHQVTGIEGTVIGVHKPADPEHHSISVNIPGNAERNVNGHLNQWDRIDPAPTHDPALLDKLTELAAVAALIVVAKDALVAGRQDDYERACSSAAAGMRAICHFNEEN